MDPTDAALSRRRLLQATAGTAATTALAGRGVADRRTVSPPERDVLRLTGQRVTSLDPIAAPIATGGDVSAEAVTQLFETLTYFPDGETDPQPRLAREIQTANDGRRVEIDLRRGVRFHDGRELTADDVVYTFERVASADQSAYGYLLFDQLGIEHETGSDGQYAPGSLAVTAESEYAVSIRLESPFHSVRSLLGMPCFSVLPAGIVGDVEGYGGEMSQEAFARNPVGCGPFVFDELDEGSQLRVEAFDGYSFETPSVEAVHWRIFREQATSYAYSVREEQAHEVSVPSERFDRDRLSIDRTDDRGRRIGTYGPLENDLVVDYFSVPDLFTQYLGFNQENTERPARLAVANVLNQTMLARDLFGEAARPAAHLTPPNLFPDNATGYRQHAREYPYGIDEVRLDRAEQVMREAGYSERSPYELELSVYGSADWTDAATTLRDQLANAHVDLTVQRMEFPTLYERGRNGDLEAYTLGWTGNYPAAPDFLQQLAPGNTDTSQSAPLAFTDWSGTAAAEEAAAAWEHIQQESDPDPGAYVAMERANWEDIVLLPVVHPALETMWYDTLDVPMHGSVGRQKYNTVREPGSDGGGGSGGGRTGGGSDAGGSADHTVVLSPDGEFTVDPGELTIGDGMTVRFEWGSDGHNLVVDSQPSGANWRGHESIENEGFVHEHDFEVPGEYEYHCAPHESIGAEGIVRVVEDGGGSSGGDGNDTGGSGGDGTGGGGTAGTTVDTATAGSDEATAASDNESGNGSATFAGDSQEMPGFGVGSALTALAAGGAIRWLTEEDGE